MEGRGTGSWDRWRNRLEHDRLGRHIAQYLPIVEHALLAVGARARAGLALLSLPKSRRGRAQLNGIVVAAFVLAAGIRMLDPGARSAAPAVAASDNTYHSPVTVITPKRKPATRPEPRPEPTASATPAPVPTIIEPVQRTPTAPAAPTGPPRVPQTEAQRLRQQLDDARERCIEQLQTSEEYRAAKANADRLELRVRALRQYDPGRELPKLSVEWINAKSELNRLKQDALLADPQVQRLEAQLRARGLLK